MRILMISRCPPYPLHLGDRLIIYHLARELSRRGHVIDLLAFADRPEDWTLDWTQVCPYFRRIELFPEPGRTQWGYLKRLLLPGARFPRGAARAWSPDMWRAIQARLSRTVYDLAHLFGGVQVYEFRPALGDLPAIITPYESYSLYLRRLAGASRRLAPTTAITWLQFHLARRFERWMFAPYRRTVVVSPRDRDELLDINPDLPVEVIPNGVDLDYFALQDAEREPATLLFTGNYEYTPNVDAARRLACDLLPEVRKSVPSVRLWLVGNAPPPALRGLHSSGVVVTGRVPDVRPYLARATVFVCPLRLGAGIKNKVLEALAMGLPVAATPLSVEGIDVQDGRDALIVDDEHMVNSVIRLLQDSDLRRKLSTNGRVLIEEGYSWARIAALYEALYWEIAG